MSNSLSPMIVSGIAMQADLTRAIADRKAAAGVVNETEYRLYVTLFVGASLDGIKVKTPQIKAIKAGLAEAGRSDRNIESVVKVICNGTLRRTLKDALADSKPLDAVFAALTEKGINSVTALRRAASDIPETDRLAAIQKAYGKLDDEQKAGFAAWLAAGAVPADEEAKPAKNREASLHKLAAVAKAAA